MQPGPGGAELPPGQPVEGSRAHAAPEPPAQAPAAVEAVPGYGDVAPEHQFRIVSSSDDDSDSETGGF